MRVIDCRTETLTITIDECDYQLIIHDSPTGDGTAIASLSGSGVVLTCGGETRGEALLLLGEWLHKAGIAMKRVAFEREGAVRL